MTTTQAAAPTPNKRRRRGVPATATAPNEAPVLQAPTTATATAAPKKSTATRVQGKFPHIAAQSHKERVILRAAIDHIKQLPRNKEIVKVQVVCHGPDGTNNGITKKVTQKTLINNVYAVLNGAQLRANANKARVGESGAASDILTANDRLAFELRGAIAAAKANYKEYKKEVAAKKQTKDAAGLEAQRLSYLTRKEVDEAIAASPRHNALDLAPRPNQSLVLTPAGHDFFSYGAVPAVPATPRMGVVSPDLATPAAAMHGGMGANFDQQLNWAMGTAVSLINEVAQRVRSRNSQNGRRE
ncbi:hypothetical protein H9P43_008057 [Blastocladiella emersonii ATCC 22665]|nr:hypothetical protein H9P43_008057 [Blastocladiella emersonii ATCC 22665]